MFGGEAAVRAAGDELIARYREPHRAYHGCRHLVWVLRHVRSLMASPDVDVADGTAVLAAAFFHDAVYEPTVPHDNERDSARLAASTTSNLGWSSDRTRRVADLVMCTADHLAPEGDADAAVLCDADLAVLGTEPSDYEAYVHGVRREYGHLDDDVWRAGRTEILESLGRRDPIFQTETARARWEARAHANIAAELATLR